MSDSQTLYLRPFVAERFYPVPHAWLRDACSAQEHDARELVLWAHVPDTEEAAFPEDRPIAYWVRNEDGLPNLMSHPVFGGYLRRMLGETDGDAPVSVQVLQQISARAGWFVLVNWLQTCDGGVIYKPRVYIEKRWPARLNTHDWAGRAALLAFCDMVTEQTLPGSDEVAPVAATVRQVRSRIQRLMPHFAHGDKVANSLANLMQVRLVALVKDTPKNPTYALRMENFDQTPIARDADIAELCGLHPDDDAHWIDLIQEFLDAQWKPPAAALEIWRQVSDYRDVVTTPEDVEAVIAMLRNKRERRVTGVRRVMRDYLRGRPDVGQWVDGHSFELGVVCGARTDAEGTQIPALYGANVRLQATQLVLRFNYPAHMSKAEVVNLLTGAELTVLQDQGRGYKTQFDLCKSLRLSKRDVGQAKIIDGNHLHGFLDYSRPFIVQMYTQKLDGHSGKGQSVSVIGHFRVKVTHR